VGDALLICSETLHMLPPHVRDWATDAGEVGSYRGAMEEEVRVRMDATSDPALRSLLLPEHQAAVEGRLLANEAASGDVVAQSKSKSSMMPRSSIAIKSGELFYWYASATLLSELDRETFFVALAAFLANAKVGGKKAQGRGLIAPVKGWQVHVNRPAESTESIDTDSIGARIGDLFRAHAAEKREELSEFLATVAA